MKPPKNFTERIDGKTFFAGSAADPKGFKIRINGAKYHPKGDYYRVWIEPTRSGTFKHILYYDLFWEKEEYEIVMPKWGGGTVGAVVKEAKLDRSMFLTPDDFANHLIGDIEELMDLKIYV